MTEPSPANAVYYKKKEKHSNTKDDYKKNHEYEQREKEKKQHRLFVSWTKRTKGMSSNFVHHLPVHRKIIVKFSIIRIFDITQVMHALKFVSVNFMFEKIALMWPIAMANTLASLLKCDLILAHNQNGSEKKRN